MKRALLILIVLFLAACGKTKIHENVDEELAKDALQLMEVVTNNVDKGILYEDADSNDKSVIDGYYDKYLGKFSTKKGSYEGVNEHISIIANATYARYIDGISLDTEKDNLKESEERLKEFISSGEGFNID